MSSHLELQQSITGPVMALLRGVIDSACFDALFTGLSFRIEEDSSVSVTAPTRYAADRVKRIYEADMLKSIRIVYPAVARLNFCAARAYSDSSAKLGAILNVPTKDGSQPVSHSNSHNGSLAKSRPHGTSFLPFEPPLSPFLRLESFESGVSNKIAHASAQTVVETPGAVYCPLFIYGGHGLGKTHLLQGIAHGLRERNPGFVVLYTSCEAFANAYIAAVQARNLDAFRNRFRSCDALLIDDVQFLTGKTKTQEELLYTIQFLRGASKQVVLSANVTPADLSRIDSRLAEILRSGLTIKLDTPEFELRVRLLHTLAKRRKWTLNDGAARVIATHIEKSVGELDGALCKMNATASATGVETSADLALSALRESGILRSGPPTLKDVLDAAAKSLNVPSDAILSNKRVANIVHARHIAIHVAKHVTAHTVVEIGRFFGNRDHSTVLSAVRKITDMSKREESVREQLQNVRRLLGK
ncbi:MAG: DnaA/Hda family protein [Planctomycetota bacterium]